MAGAQAEAIKRSSSVPSDAATNWIEAGGRPILCVQALQDVIAPPDLAGRALYSALGPEQVTLVEIDEAGHALLPEQPLLVLRAVLEFLQAHRIAFASPRTGARRVYSGTPTKV